MNWKRLKAQLIYEYLADLREIRDDLRSMEGWIAFALLTVALLITAAWFFVSLGFSPDNHHVRNLASRLGAHMCRPVDNFSGVVIFIDFVMLVFMTAISLGNAFLVMRRMRQGLPRQPRDLIVSASLMLFLGVGGIVFMLRVC